MLGLSSHDVVDFSDFLRHTVGGELGLGVCG